MWLFGLLVLPSAAGAGLVRDKTSRAERYVLSQSIESWLLTDRAQPFIPDEQALTGDVCCSQGREQVTVIKPEIWHQESPPSLALNLPNPRLRIQSKASVIRPLIHNTIRWS